MNEFKQTEVLAEELEEPKSSKLAKLITELVVQFYQAVIDTCTAYRRALWLRQRQHSHHQLHLLANRSLAKRSGRLVTQLRRSEPPCQPTRLHRQPIWT